MMDSVTYKKEIVRMWDSLRKGHKGERSCIGVNCEACPLDEVCDGYSSYNAFEAIRIVEQWSEEHPNVTNADKFKEVFGREPKDNLAEYYCPSFALERCPNKGCYNCKKSFWESEYKAPTESEEDVKNEKRFDRNRKSRDGLNRNLRHRQGQRLR